MARSYDPPEDVIDHTPDDKAPPNPTETIPEARLRYLRLKAGMGPLEDGEKAELDKLALAEADAAGHPAPVEQTGPAMEPGAQLMSDIIAVMEHIVAVLPVASAIAPRLAAMRQRLTDMISPPDEK